MRTMLLALLYCAACAACAAAAHAQTGINDLTWTPPTTNTDGSPLTNLAGYRVYWGTVAGNYPNSATLTTPAATTYRVSGLVVGTRYNYVVTARAATGTESVFSNVASATARSSAGTTPVLPTGLRTVTPDVPVYAPFLTRDAQSMIQVGVAPADVPCDGAQQARGFGPGEVLYLVPVASVRLFPGVAPEAVFAPCALP